MMGRSVAAAVQSHIRALRLLRREDTTILSIADALGLTTNEVLEVMRNYHVTGAKVAQNRSRAKVGPTSPIVELKPTRAANGKDERGR